MVWRLLPKLLSLPLHHIVATSSTTNVYASFLQHSCPCITKLHVAHLLCRFICLWDGDWVTITTRPDTNEEAQELNERRSQDCVLSYRNDNTLE